MAPDDLPRVARLWLESWRSTGLMSFADPDLCELRDELERSGARVRLACSGTSIIGFAAFEVAGTQLSELFVDPPAQGMGVGTLLLDEVKLHMTRGFWLRTAADNVRARRFYERRGLRLEGERPHPDAGKTVAIYLWP